MRFETAVHWLFLATTLAFFVSGYGILNYGLTERLTFGLLSKPNSYRIHLSLMWPFVTLLGAHLYLTLSRRPRGSE